jgi:hypothetical protein
MASDCGKPNCYLCGSRTADTKDHLFPKGLFPRPLPTDLPSGLPACMQRNNELSKAEEQFRFFLASGAAYESESGHRIWNQRIRPDLKGRRSGLKPLVQSMVKIAKVKSKSGILLGYWPVLEQDQEPINRVLRKIVKGLYYLDTNQILPTDIQILCGHDRGNIKNLLSPPLDKVFRESRRVDYGNVVVSYWRNIVKDDPATSITWLRFYEDKLFMVVTYREEDLNT